MIWKSFDRLVSVGSGEWLLTRRANGGTVIVARAALTASLLFLLAVAIKSRLEPARTWTFDLGEFLTTSGNILPWYGALFAGAYAGLYSRFSSQWSYLADLYNQIMATQVQHPMRPENQDVYINWFVAFIEDAESLHLALKPSFASVISSLLAKPGVREAYCSGGPESKQALAELQMEITKVLGRDCRRPCSRSRGHLSRTASSMSPTKWPTARPVKLNIKSDFCVFLVAKRE